MYNIGMSIVHIILFYSELGITEIMKNQYR